MPFATRKMGKKFAMETLPVRVLATSCAGGPGQTFSKSCHQSQRQATSTAPQGEQTHK